MDPGAEPRGVVTAGTLRVRASELGAGRTSRGLGRLRWTPLEPTELDRAPWDVREEGAWISGPARGAAFRGGYRWEAAGGGLLVSHLRQGPDAPVPLVRLVRTGPARLDSEAPHACGDDRYVLRVWLGEDGLRLRWTIRGPRQRIRLRVGYGAPTPAPILQILGGIVDRPRARRTG